MSFHWMTNRRAGPNPFTDSPPASSYGHHPFRERSGPRGMFYVSRYRRVLGSLLGFLLLLAACGGEQAGGDVILVAGEPEEGYEDPENGVSYAPSRSLGFGFAGEDVSAPGPSLRVKAGEPVTITLQNDHFTDGGLSRALHNFVVVAADDLDADEPLWGSKIMDIEAGEEDSVTFTPDTPGTYYFVCSIPGHRLRGMFGEFIVEG